MPSEHYRTHTRYETLHVEFPGHVRNVENEETADVRFGSRSAALQTIIAKSCTGTGNNPSVLTWEVHDFIDGEMGTGDPQCDLKTKKTTISTTVRFWRRECETDVIHQTFAKHYAELFNQAKYRNRVKWMKSRHRIQLSKLHSERFELSIPGFSNIRWDHCESLLNICWSVGQEVHRHAVESGLGRCGAHDIDFLLTHALWHRHWNFRPNEYHRSKPTGVCRVCFQPSKPIWRFFFEFDNHFIISVSSFQFR